jgi:hypothetical protein
LEIDEVECIRRCKSKSALSTAFCLEEVNNLHFAIISVAVEATLVGGGGRTRTGMLLSMDEEGVRVSMIIQDQQYEYIAV